MDAFLVASIFISMSNSIFADTQGKSFIPFICHESSEEVRKDKIATILKFNLILFSIITGIIFLFSSLIISLIAPGLGPEQHDIASKALKIISFLLLICNLSGIIRGLQEYNGKFTHAAVLEFLFPACCIIFLLILKNRFSIFSLPITSVASQAMVFALYLVFLLRNGYRLTSSIPLFSQTTLAYIKLMLPIMFSAVFFGLISFSETFIGSFLDKGSISYLNYCQKVIRYLPVLAAPVSTIYYPLLAKISSRSDDKEFYETYTRGLSLLFVIVCYISCFTLLFPETFVAILFERGSFTHHDTLVVAKLMYYYALVLFCSPLGLFLTNAYYCRKMMKTGAALSIISSIVNIGCNILFSRMWGVYGLAAGSSMGYLAGNTLQFLFIKKISSEFKYTPVLSQLARIAIAAILSMVIIDVLHRFAALPLNGSIPLMVVGLMIYSVLYLAVFLFFCYILKTKIVVAQAAVLTAKYKGYGSRGRNN
jgi:putative peptidoglycan lipid II flippase